MKFHRAKRVEASKQARACRDFVDKKLKNIVKASNMVERERVMALRNNDMKAYKQMIEEGRDKRLKFLMDVTDEYLNKIKRILESERNLRMHLPSTGIDGSSSSSSSSPSSSALLLLFEVATIAPVPNPVSRKL